MKFETSEGVEAAKLASGEWVQLEGMKLGHGCCDCGLFHDVEFRIVDDFGNEPTSSNDGLNIQMKWSRDQGETAKLRDHQTPEDVKDAVRYLVNDIKSGPHIQTYCGVDVRKFNKDQLLLLVDWLAQDIKRLRGF